MKKQGSGCKAGFTLLELIISLTVMGILSGVSYQLYQVIWKKTKSSQRFADACRWHQALLDYYDCCGEFPSCCAVGQWINLQKFYSEFIDECSKQTQGTCHFAPQKRSGAGIPTVWFLWGTQKKPKDIILELEATTGRGGIEQEKIFGWGTEVLFYLP